MHVHPHDKRVEYTIPLCYRLCYLPDALTISGSFGDAVRGYAKAGQSSAGIHFRVYSRAFIIKQGDSRVVIVNVDSAMIGDIVKIEVVKRLQEKYGPSLYSEENILLTATHTHSSVGGFMQYLLYNIHTQGFIRQVAYLGAYQLGSLARTYEEM
ncbi:hypothetical protein HPB51_029500 [Rhipicephalus microplus]|uniref:Neutral ceramidase n=1 Tax=Rhipicephalus microplus TaxID=6941 RepID=A0A9J6CU26_RHIMP|nr:hypothetical protein HPB51_029500 [Rhipicephalus microplus]